MHDIKPYTIWKVTSDHIFFSGKTHTSLPHFPQGTREELVERLRADYDRNYFLTGDIDVPLYTEDCEFADPFTSFRGRQRFVQNLKPFGFDSEV